jgi:hypothetical protein
MMNFALFVPALLWGLLSVTSACAWSEAQPTLVFQVSHTTRGRLTEQELTRTRQLAFTAAVSIALERAEVLPAGDVDFAPPYSALDSENDPAALSCTRAPSALCAWARSKEESAFSAALEYVESEP